MFTCLLIVVYAFAYVRYTFARLPSSHAFPTLLYALVLLLPCAFFLLLRSFLLRFPILFHALGFPHSVDRSTTLPSSTEPALK